MPDFRRQLTAKQQIAKLRRLLLMRYYRRISRKAFLGGWALTRRRLAWTPEYKAFVVAVKAKSNGMCVRCGKLGHHAHHKVRVSSRPGLVLTVSNGDYLCVGCHADIEGMFAKDGKLVVRGTTNG